MKASQQQTSRSVTEDGDEEFPETSHRINFVNEGLEEFEDDEDLNEEYHDREIYESKLSRYQGKYSPNNQFSTQEGDLNPEYIQSYSNVNQEQSELNRYDRSQTGTSSEKDSRTDQSLQQKYLKIITPRFYSQRNPQLEFQLPQMTNRIRPKIYIRNNDILNHSLKEQIFYALKDRVHVVKQFQHSMWMKRINRYFGALKGYAHQNTRLRNLESKIIDKKYKADLSNVFLAFTGYLSHKISLKRRLEIYEIKQSKISNKEIFKKWRITKANLVLNRHQNAEIEIYRRSSLLKKSISNLKKYSSRKNELRNRLTYFKEHKIHNDRGFYFTKWLNLLPDIMMERDNQYKADNFREFNLLK